MTSVSLINPYAPQPAADTSDTSGSASQMTKPVAESNASSGAGLASDQSGYGAGNGSGRGGADLQTLLKRGQESNIQHATSKSIIEAQSDRDAATQFLERQASQRTQAKAAEQERAAEALAAQTARDKAEAAKASEPEYVMPNPLPTAPILQREDGPETP